MGVAIVGQMSMVRMGRIVVAVALVAAAWRFVCFSAARYVGRYPPLPGAIANIETFNNLSGFVQDGDNKRRFRYVGGRKEPYLRFCAQDIDPAPYRLSLKFRAAPSLLDSAWCKSANGHPKVNKSISGDTCEFTVDMGDSSLFKHANGRVYVGIGFKNSKLRVGDIVELLDFKFSRR